MRLMPAPGLLVLLLILAACGADTPVSADPSDAQPPPTSAADGTLLVGEARLDGPAMSVDAALAAGSGPVKVGGALFVERDGTMLLCSAIAESFPPQCGGTRLRVDGLDLASLELEEANGVRWSEGVELVGTVEPGA